MTKRFLYFLFFFCEAACCDSLILRNGTRVNGKWWATDAEVVHFVVSGRLERYARHDVDEIVFGDAAVPPGPPTATSPEPLTARVARSAGLPEAQPEEIGVVYFQDGRGNLLALEQIVAANRRQPAGSSGRRADQYWEMPGAQSSFRLRAGTELRFAVEVPGGISPSTFKLYPLESKAGTRRTKAGGATPPEIPVSVRRIAANVFVYSVVGDLPPGEYFFSPTYSNDSFCFGIDAPAAR